MENEKLIKTEINDDGSYNEYYLYSPEAIVFHSRKEIKSKDGILLSREMFVDEDFSEQLTVELYEYEEDGTTICTSKTANSNICSIGNAQFHWTKTTTDSKGREISCITAYDENFENLFSKNSKIYNDDGSCTSMSLISG